jgi:hypothetical protein
MRLKNFSSKFLKESLKVVEECISQGQAISYHYRVVTEIKNELTRREECMIL